MQNPSLDRDAWLERALEVLRAEGIQGVRVERLARDLDVTKGSFYWHFSDRGDLYRSILDYWDERYTGVVVNHLEFQHTEPREALLSVMMMVRKEGLDQYELAIRAWADHDPMAFEAVTKAYSRRKGFIRSLFERMGFQGDDAEVRTRLALCYLSWEPNMYPEESQKKNLQLLKLHHELLTKK